MSTQRFPKYGDKFAAAFAGCFNCTKPLDPKKIRPTGFPDDEGAWSIACGACGMQTHFDVFRKPETFLGHMERQIRDDTPRAIACWLAAIYTHFDNFEGRPCFLDEIPERWFDFRMLNPTTGMFVGIREDWSW